MEVKEDESKIFGRASEEFLKIRREGEELQQELMQMKTRREEERLQEVTWARHIKKDEEEDQNEESAVRAQRRPSFFFVCVKTQTQLHVKKKNAVAKEYWGNAFREYCWKHEKGRGNHSAPMFEFGVCSGSREHKGKLEASAASGELLRQLQVVRDQRCN